MQIAKLLEEYNELDHEDVVGGLKTRFRYRAVEPIKDGLDVFEILSLSDKDLNSVVGLRQLAPYHEKSSRVKPNYKALGEVREKLKEAGLYVDKRERKAKHARKAQKSDKYQKTKRFSETSSHNVGKGGKGRHGVAAAENGAEAGRSSSAGRKSGSAGSESDGAGKKKRPGPALRRALKEQAAANAAVRGDERAAGSVAGQEHKSSGREAPVQGKRGPLPLSAEEMKCKRLESYGKLMLPGQAAQRHRALSCEHKEARQGSGQGAQGGVVGGKQGSEGGLEQGKSSSGLVDVSKLPKAARKNAKRALRRQQLRLAQAVASSLL